MTDFTGTIENSPKTQKKHKTIEGKQLKNRRKHNPKS